MTRLFTSATTFAVGAVLAALMMLLVVTASGSHAQGGGAMMGANSNWSCPMIWDQASCLFPNCKWTTMWNASGQCVFTPCREIPLENCPLNRCAGNLSGSLKCSDFPCMSFKSVDACSMSSARCWWRDDVGACVDKPCEMREPRACDPNLCTPWFNSTGYITSCGARSCSSWMDAGGCAGAAAAGACKWIATATQQMCVNVTCNMFNSSQCDTLQTADASCVNINSTKCWQPSILQNIDCTLAMDNYTCEATTPMGRCAWRAMMPSGAWYCVPANLSLGMDCQSFSAATCPRGRCGWVNGYCLNPACWFFGNASECMMRRCLWLGGMVGKCVDPQVLKFPCDKLPDGLCAVVPGRCSWVAGKCIPFSDSPALALALAMRNSTLMATPNCGSFKDEDSCVSMPPCNWNGTKCFPPPCWSMTNDTCDKSRCRVRDGMCVNACPPEAPFLCPYVRVCATGPNECVAQSSNQVLCWNAKVVDTPDQCPCPPFRSVRCSNTSSRPNACVPDISNCTVPDCPMLKPKMCWDGSCAGLLQRCPCPPEAPVDCGDGTCRRDQEECMEQCPEGALFRCPNGQCAPRLDGCSCPFDSPFRCPTTRQCVANRSSCPCPGSMTRCTDAGGECSMNCSTVCMPGYFRCPSGWCAPTPFGCPCPQELRDIADVSVSIASVLTTKVFNNRWHHIGARAVAKACGRVVLVNASMWWTVVDANTRAVVFGMMGTILAIPPFKLMPSSDYIITATVRMNRINGGLQATTTSASIRISVVSAKPIVSIIGGDIRMVPRGAPFSLGIDVAKLGMMPPGQPPKLSWMCQDADTGGACPDAIDNALVFNNSLAVMFPWGVNVTGNFSITAAFRGVTSKAQTLAVIDRPSNVPRIEIVGVPPIEHLLTDDNVTLYCKFPRGKMTVTWWINGVWVAAKSAAGDAITFAPSSYFVRNATNIIKVVGTPTDANLAAQGITITSELRLWVPVMLTPMCTVMRAPDEPGMYAVAGLSNLWIKASWSGGDGVVIDPTNLRFKFIGQIDSSDARIPLTPFANELPVIQVRAPVLRGNPSMGTLGVYLEVRLVDSDTVIGRGMCSQMIAAADGGWLNDTLATIGSDMAAAVQMVDQSEVSRLTSIISAVADFVGQGPNATMMRRGLKRIAAMGAKLVANGGAGGADALTRGQRSSAVQNAFNLVSQGSMPDASGEGDIISALRSAVNVSAAGGADGDDALDASTDAKAVLKTLDGLATKSWDVAKIALDTARAVAAQLQRGDKGKVSVDKYKIFSIARAADDLDNATVDFEEVGSLQLPSGFSLGDSSAAGQIGSTIMKDNLFGDGGRDTAKERRATDIIDVSMQVDGVKQVVRNLNASLGGSVSGPAQFQFKLDVSWSVNITRNKTKVRCVYFDEVSGMWSENGLAALPVTIDAATGAPIVRCNTSHFSTFSVYVEAEPDATTTTTTTTTAAGQTTTTGAGGSTAATTTTTAGAGQNTTTTTAAAGQSNTTAGQTTTTTMAGQTTTTTTKAATTTTTASGSSGSTTTKASTTMASTTASPAGQTTPAPTLLPPGVSYPLPADQVANFNVSAFAVKLAKILNVNTSAFIATIGTATSGGAKFVVITFATASSSVNDNLQKTASSLSSADLSTLGVSQGAPFGGSVTTAAPSSDEEVPIGAIVGGAVGGLALIVIILLIIKNKSSQGTGTTNDNLEGTTRGRELLVVPSTERPMGARPSHSEL